MTGEAPSTDVASDLRGGPEVPDDDTGARPGERHRARRHRWLRRGAVAAGVVALAVGITSFTGLPAPGPLERYPVGTLNDLVDSVHGEAGLLRTPDDCWRTTFRAQRDDAPDGPPRPVAAVDWLRSRVVVRVHADAVGQVEWRTADAVQRRLDRLIAANPEFEPGMVVTEASPDGWSPLVDCERVTRGWL